MGGVLGDQGQDMLWPAACGRKLAGQSGEVRGARGFICERLDAAEKLLRVVAAQHEQGFCPGQEGRGALGRSAAGIGLFLAGFEDDMETVAVEAGGGHARAAWSVGAVADPVLRKGRCEERLRAGQFGQRLAQPAQGRQDFLIKRQAGFDDGNEPGGRAGVAHVRMSAAQGARGFAVCPAEKRIQEPGFLGVGLRAGGAAGFEVSDGGRINGGFRVGAFQGFSARVRRERVAAAGRAQAADDRINAVAVAAGVVEAFEDHGHGAFAGHRAVGRWRQTGGLRFCGRRAGERQWRGGRGCRR